MTRAPGKENEGPSQPKTKKGIVVFTFQPWTLCSAFVDNSLGDQMTDMVNADKFCRTMKTTGMMKSNLRGTTMAQT